MEICHYTISYLGITACRMLTKRSMVSNLPFLTWISVYGEAGALLTLLLSKCISNHS